MKSFFGDTQWPQSNISGRHALNLNHRILKNNAMNSDPQKDLAKLLRKAQAGDKFALQQLCKELEGYVHGFF